MRMCTLLAYSGQFISLECKIGSQIHFSGAKTSKQHENALQNRTRKCILKLHPTSLRCECICIFLHELLRFEGAICFTFFFFLSLLFLQKTQTDIVLDSSQHHLNWLGRIKVNRINWLIRSLDLVGIRLPEELLPKEKHPFFIRWCHFVSIGQSVCQITKFFKG